MQQVLCTKQNVYLGIYSTIMGIAIPAAQHYQLRRIYPFRSLHTRGLLTAVPTQTLARFAQIKLCTHINQHISPWVAFGFIGILQGAFYGHANMKLYQTPINIRNVFRGSQFAMFRDMGSQGIPFVLTEPLSEFTGISKWPCLAFTSIGSTYLTQTAHNCQSVMQTNPKFTAFDTWIYIYRHKMFLKGVCSRLVLLGIVNVLNNVLITEAWNTNTHKDM